MQNIIFCIVISSLLCEPKEAAAGSCQSCPEMKANTLNIHIVPYSYLNLGWRKTIDEYYYSTPLFVRQTEDWFSEFDQNVLPGAGVQAIFGSVMESLHANPNRSFIISEMAFFIKWWEKQDESVQRMVKNLVSGGQLEFVNGGWSVNDEATTQYPSMIDQFALGLRKIADLFGDCGRPNIAWATSSFGHSKQMASLFSNMMYDAMVIANVDFRDASYRATNKRLEFMWQTNTIQGNKSNIFTTILPELKPEHCYDILCWWHSSIVIDDENNPNYNLELLADDFVNYVLRLTKYYSTYHLLLPLGGPFMFQDAHMHFSNFEKIMKFVNDRTEMNVAYSTPSCYFKNVLNIFGNRTDLTTEYNDFFPYASVLNAYWAGLYTSRPSFKLLERIGSQFLKVMNQLISYQKILSFGGNSFGKDLIPLREAMGVMQHHQAVTGTHSDRAGMDYVKSLTDSMAVAESHLTQILSTLLYETVGKYNVDFHSCFLANITHCDTVFANPQQSEFMVVVYNPLSRSVRHFVKIPVVNVFIYEVDNVLVKLASTSVFCFNQPILATEEIRTSNCELIAPLTTPAHGFNVLLLRPLTITTVNPMFPDISARQCCGDDTNGFKIDESTGLLKEVTLDGYTLNIVQEFLYYESASINTNITSGAYIFRPQPRAKRMTNYTRHEHLDFAKRFQNTVAVSCTNGTMFVQCTQDFDNGFMQSIRMYKGANYVEFDWVIGPLDLEKLTGNQYGVEVVSRFVTNLQSENVFFTDTNGRGIQKRIRNHRSYPYNNEEPVAGNYYPVTSYLMLKDQQKDVALGVVTDRSQGGTSLRDGEIELMIHRRLKTDDLNGLHEILSESEYGHGLRIRGQHYLTFGQTASASAAIKILAEEKQAQPWAFYATTTYYGRGFQRLNVSLLKYSFPPNINILSLEPWDFDNDEYLMRFEHVLLEDGPKASTRPTTFNLNSVFTYFTVTDIRETTIDGNQWLDGGKCLSNVSASIAIRLEPAEIRTFVVKIARRIMEYPSVPNKAIRDDFFVMKISIALQRIFLFSLSYVFVLGNTLKPRTDKNLKKRLQLY